MPRKKDSDPLEAAIEATADEYVPITGEKRDQLETILRSGRKGRSINIRISEHDLLALKRRAGQEGLAYQTLITSVLHRFVTDRLVDEDQVRKAVKLLARG